MWGVGVSSHAGIREGNTISIFIRAHLDHRGHFFQIDLVHDAVTGRDHVNILERSLGPLDKVKAVFVTTVFNLTVLAECIRVETGSFYSQRVVNDQLGRNNRVDHRRVTALVGDRVTQAGEVYQCGLA